MQSLPGYERQLNAQGISAETPKILDIDIHIKVFYKNNQLTEQELEEYKEQNINAFCNSKRSQKTTLEQIFKEFQALIAKTDAFVSCNFTNFTAIQKVPRNMPSEQQYEYNEEQGRQNIESFFNNFDQSAIYEVEIIANLFD